MYKKRSFRTQLISAILVFISIFLVFYLVLFQLVKQIIIKQYSEAAMQSVNAVADNIDYSLQEMEQLSNSILLNRELINSLKNQQTETYLTSLNSYYASSVLVEGIYTYSSMGYQSVGANIADGLESFPIDQLENTSGEIIWFPAEEKDISILSSNIEKNYFSMGRKILEINSLEELGYMRIEADEQILQETYKNLIEDGGNIYIFDMQGNPLSSSDENLKWAKSQEQALIQEILLNDSSGNVEYTDNGTAFVAIYSSCNNAHWRIVKTIPENILYADINNIQIFAAFAGISFFIAMLTVSLLYAGKITQPITKMIAQMQEVEEGNLSVRVHNDVNYELDSLGESFNHMIQRIEELMEHVVLTERNKNELELEVLHAQINPHFLYNTLNTIRWMAKIKGEDSINNALVALVKLLRVSISLGNSMITIKEEIDYIENYLVIQRLRFNQLFKISYTIQKEYEDIYIPKLILQPIVENSLIYGIDEAETFAGQARLLTIRIYTQKTADSLEIIVEDNGPGIKEDILENLFTDEKNINKFSTVGLNNVNQRLQMYFGYSYGLNVFSRIGEGTKIIIRVPIQNHYEGDKDV